MSTDIAECLLGTRPPETHIYFICLLLFVILGVLTVLQNFLAKTHTGNVHLLVVSGYNFTFNQFSFPVDPGRRLNGLVLLLGLNYNDIPFQQLCPSQLLPRGIITMFSTVTEPYRQIHAT